MKYFRILATCVMLLVGAIFLLSVAFPPTGELKNVPTDSFRREFADAEPAPIGDEPVAPSPQSAAKQKVQQPQEETTATTTRFAVQEEENYDIHLEVRDNQTGEAIADALIHLKYLENGKKQMVMDFYADPQGKLKLRRLAVNQYSLKVSAYGYFPSDPIQYEIPGAHETTQTIYLKPGGAISGRVVRVDDTHPNSGIIRFKNAETIESHVVRIKLDGSFESPPLVGGVWITDWLEHYNATANPVLTASIPVVPRDRREIEIVIPTRKNKQSSSTGKIAGTVILK